MIDADDGYGDVKNVTRTIRGYEALGASALFFKDQQTPKRCGHLKDELHKMGFFMILYPTTILFRVTHAIEQTVGDLIAGKQLLSKDSVNFQVFENIVGLPQWKEIEKKFHHED
ncbi:unnamed protein product [Rotaria sp. Silwood2]|nr:unnamed protein product [Rotaria sp. Silwood2]